MNHDKLMISPNGKQCLIKSLRGESTIYISRQLALRAYFTDQVKTILWAVWVAQHTQYIWFMHSDQSTEVDFTSFLSGGFATMAVINPPERKPAHLCAVQ